MSKRKGRALQDLYDLTGKIRGQEISPVLKGSSCVKRSLEETNHDLRTDLETFPPGKAIGNGYLNENCHMRAQSGTCNVCATPCSSCMHYNCMVSVMESKVEDEFSDDASMVLPLKSRASDDQQRTASEASNLHSASSSHDSLSENAQSKVTTRTCDVSDTFEDVEMLTKLSSRTSRGHEEQQGIDCHSDDISCVTGAKEECRHDTASKDSPRKCSGTASETAHVCQKSNPSGFLSAKDVHALQLQHSHSQTGNSLFTCGDSKDSGENSSSQLRVEAPECSLEHGDSPLAGQPTSNTFNEQKSAIPESPSALQKAADCGSSLIRHGSSPCMVTKIDMDGNPPTKSIKCSDINKKSEKSCASFDVSAQSPPISESDHSESDTMLDDVKVCDLCGDAGREDLLAICSRCSDGAEHIYCMRVMLDKVPEGDWLCEGCQLKEDAEKIKAAKIERISTIEKASSLNEKNKTPGGSFDAKHLPKLDVKAQETEEDQGVRIASSPRLPIKRSADKFEVPVVSKRQPIETSAGSPGMASPGRKPVLSRETSFKNFDAGKIKPSHTAPSFAGNSSQGGAHSVNSSGPSTSRMQPVVQSSRGILSRSATFNNSNSKPKVKQLFEDVAQKKKLERQLSAGNVRKEGLTRTISKLTSFKSSGLGHSNFNETRAKTQSQSLSHGEDQRGLKQSKEHNPMERKNCFKLDSSVVSPSHVAGSKDVFRSEGTSVLGSANNSRNPKAAHHERKLNPSSDSAIFVTRKGSENSNASDVRVEVKKQPCLSAVSAVPASNGKPNPGEQKPCQVDSKEDTMASASSAAEGFCSSHNLTLQDGLFRFQESTNQDRKNSSFNSPTRNISFGSKYVRCLKCNEMGHIPQFCTSASLHVSAVKASAARSPRDATNRSSKWRNAVAAAVSRTRILGSSRLPDQLDDSSLTSTDLRYEVASKDQVSSSSSCLRNLSSQECLFHEQEALRSLTADSCWNASTIVATQRATCPVEPACASRQVNLNIASISDGTKPKPYMNHLPSPTSVVGTPLGIPIIPVHDYIWQGGFEVKRSGRPTAFCDGIQAHLSTCASTKVANVVEKFPYKIWLEEVPRLSSWPVEFQRKCATEDNIALYFFAKDLDSYEKNYEKLLENMIKNDLALKGCFDRIELLIFPSNQLPKKCQRWNRLFFLWAVFIVRENCSIVNDGLSSEKNTSCLHPEIHPLASVNQLNSSPQTCASTRITTENQQLCSEKEVRGNNESGEVTKLQPPIEAMVVQMDPNKGKVVLTLSDSTNCRQMGLNSVSPEQGGTSSASSKIPVPTPSVPEAAAVSSRNKEEQALDKERLIDNATSLKVDVWREPKRQEASSREIRLGSKHTCSNSSEVISEASAETSVKSGKARAQKESMGCILIDEERESKKMRISHKQILGDRFSPEIVDLDSCLPDKQKDDCSDDIIVSKSARTTERYLFPVDSGPVKDLVSGDSIPCQILSSDDEGLPESDAPNLELALGAVKKSSSKQGILPLFVPLADDKSNCSKLADPVTNNVEDVMSASLSLSLAFPSSGKEETVKLVSKEEALPKKQNHVKTSLLLFGSSVTDA